MVEPRPTRVVTELPTLPFVRGRIDQLGIVVRDLEHSIAHYTTVFGLSEWLGYNFNDRLLGDRAYRGKPGRFEMRVAVAGKNPQVELIQPVRGPSIYDEYLQEHGDGLHHLAVFVRDLRASVGELEARGFRVVQSGGSYRGCERGGFAYFDTTPELGITFEVLELPSPRLPHDFGGDRLPRDRTGGAEDGCSNRA